MALDLSTILTSGNSSLIQASMFKAVLLHKGIFLSLAHLVHAFGIKEAYETMELVLHLFKNSICNWNIWSDLKVIGLLLGLQIRYTKQQFFLCRWDSQDDELHYIWKDCHSSEAFF